MTTDCVACRSAALSCIFDCGQQRAEVKWSVVALPVDEERWRAVDSAPDPAVKIVPHPRRMLMLTHLANESRLIETKCSRILQQVFVFEGILILVEQSVHLPILVLRTGCLSRFRRMLGVRMHLFAERK